MFPAKLLTRRINTEAIKGECHEIKLEQQVDIPYKAAHQEAQH
jgi:hypothetical protein